MGRLDYDTGAFSFFFLALSLAGLIPYSISVVFQFRNAQKSVQVDDIAPTSELYENVFVTRLAKKKRAAVVAARKSEADKVFKRLGFLALGWALFFGYLLTRESGADIHKFDPFEILGISSSASEIEIKKAYKKLSLVHHPDRWANKDKADRALAETKFIMVAKAYEALTDPVARENFQKYGNPDGRQALEMSIGLPSWLLEKENQGWVIASYLLLSIIVFPAGVMLLTSNAAKTGAQPKRLYPDTDELLRAGIRNEARSFVTFAELFALSAEFKTLVYRSEDEKKAVLELRNQMAREDRYPMKPTSVVVSLMKQAPQLKASEGNEKALVLVFVHLNRLHDRLSEDLMDDLEFMLSCSPIILKAMVSHARVTCNVNVLTTAIIFQQHLNQAALPGPAHLTQFPHVSLEDVEYLNTQIMKKLKLDNKNRTRTITQELFVNSRGTNTPILDDPKKQRDFDEVLNRMPFKDLIIQSGTLMQIENTTGGKSKDIRKNEYTFDEKSVQGDFIHFVCDLVEQNTSRKCQGSAAIAHTPYLPHDVKEEWYVIIAGGPSPKGFNNIPSGDVKVVAFGTVEDDCLPKLRVDLVFSTSNNSNDWMGSAEWPVGNHQVAVMVFPNAYVDNMKITPVPLKLHDPKTVPKFRYHEEDERLDSEPTSLMAMLQNQTEPEYDSDFEEGAPPRRNGDDADDDIDATEEDVD